MTNDLVAKFGPDENERAGTGRRQSQAPNSTDADTGGNSDSGSNDLVARFGREAPTDTESFFGGLTRNAFPTFTSVVGGGVGSALAESALLAAAPVPGGRPAAALRLGGGLLGSVAGGFGGAGAQNLAVNALGDSAPDVLTPEAARRSREENPVADTLGALAADPLSLRRGPGGPLGGLFNRNNAVETGGSFLLGAGADAAVQGVQTGEVDPLRALAAGGSEAVFRVPRSLANDATEAIIRRPVGRNVGRITGQPLQPSDGGGGAQNSGLSVAEAENISSQSEATPASIAQALEEQVGVNRPQPPRRTPQQEREQGQEFEREVLGGTEVTRREDIESIDPATGEITLREGAQPARDPSGQQGNPETFGALELVQRIADEEGVTLTPANRQAVADQVNRGVEPTPPRQDTQQQRSGKKRKRGRKQQQQRQPEPESLSPDRIRQLVREFSEQGAAEAFSQATARQQQREQQLANTDGSSEAADFQPGGRTFGNFETRSEGVLLLDPRRDRNGQLRGGTAVESTGRADSNGNLIVRDLDTGREIAAPLNRLEQVSVQDSPRRQQDFGDRAQQPPDGVGNENPGPRRATDRQSSRSPRDLSGPPPREVEGDVEPEPGTGPQRGPDNGLQEAGDVFGRAVTQSSNSRSPERPQSVVPDGSRDPEIPGPRVQNNNLPEPQQRQTQQPEPASGDSGQRQPDSNDPQPGESRDEFVQRRVNENPNIRNRDPDDGIRRGFERRREQEFDLRQREQENQSQQDDTPQVVRDRANDRASRIAQAQSPQEISRALAEHRNDPDVSADSVQQMASLAEVRREQLADGNIEPVTDPDQIQQNLGQGTLSFLGTDQLANGIQRVLASSMFRGAGNPQIRAWSTEAADFITELRNRSSRNQPQPVDQPTRRNRTSADVAPRDQGVRGTLNTTNRFYNQMLGSTDGILRSLAARFPNSTTIQGVADAFKHKTGADSDGLIQIPLSNRRRKSANKFGKRLRGIIQEAKSNGIRRTDEAQQDRIIKMMENPQLINPKTAEGKMAQDMRKLFNDLFDVQKEAGIDINYVEGFAPRWLSREKMMQDDQGFLKAAEEAYRRDGSDAETAKLQAASLFDAVVEGKGRKSAGGDGQSKPNSTKPRKLSRDAALKLDRFWEKNIEKAASNQVLSALHRAELAKTRVRTSEGEMTFGEDMQNLDAIMDQIKREEPNVTPEDLNEIRNNIMVSANAIPNNASDKIQQMFTGVRNMTALSLMDQTVFSASAELATGAFRATSGNLPEDMIQIMDNFRILAQDSADGIVRGVSNGTVTLSQGKEEAHDLAEYLNIIAGDGFSETLNSQMMGDETAGQIQSRAMDKFFQNNMLTQITDYSRVLTLRQGRNLVRTLSKRVVRGKGGRDRSAFALREMGIERGEERAFAEWFSRNFGDEFPTAGALERLRQRGGQDEKMVNDFNKAMTVFTDQAIQAPSASDVPPWAENPFGRMATQMMRFLWSFHDNIVKRPARQLVSQDLDTVDKLNLMLSQGTAGAALTGVAILGTVGRDWVSETIADDPQTPSTTNFKLQRGFSFSGFQGRADPLIQIASGLRYDASFGDLIQGAGGSNVVDFLDSASKAAFDNTENTNTQERNFAKALHQIAIAPAMQLGLAAAPRAGFVTKALTSGGTVLGVEATEDPIVDAIGGQESAQARARRLGRPSIGFFEDERSPEVQQLGAEAIEQADFSDTSIQNPSGGAGGGGRRGGGGRGTGRSSGRGTGR
mgnify:CR=1 FL=1